ncbi:MAG: hypothetical protein R3E48_21600 [Burkholderiaceae bacterium]
MRVSVPVLASVQVLASGLAQALGSVPAQVSGRAPAWDQGGRRSCAGAGSAQASGLALPVSVLARA